MASFASLAKAAAGGGDPRNNLNSMVRLSGVEMDKLRSLRKNKLFRRIESDIRDDRDRKRKPG